MKSGFKFLYPCYPDTNPHLHVVLTEPDQQGNFLVVWLTSKRSGSDPTVVVNPGDHPFIKRPTSVAYFDAQIISKSKLENELKLRIAKPRDPVSDEIFQKIRGGLSKSFYTKRRIKEYFSKISPS